MFQLKKILVPLDGSTKAEKALQPAIQLAKAFSAEITLLRAVPTSKVVAPFIKVDITSQVAQADQKRQAQNYLKGMRMVNKEEGVVIKTAVLSGRPAASISQYANENGIDLIILAGHGSTGISRWRYGEITSKLLLEAPCSTLIVYSDENDIPLRFKQILIPLDGSEAAEKAVEPITAIAKQMEAKTILFQVTPPVQQAVGTESTQALTSQIRNQVERYLQSVRNRFKNKQTIHTQVETGPFAQSILDYAQTEQVDLIALTTHGETSDQTFSQLGSIAEKIVRDAKRAVLIVRL